MFKLCSLSEVKIGDGSTLSGQVNGKLINELAWMKNKLFSKA